MVKRNLNRVRLLCNATLVRHPRLVVIGSTVGKGVMMEISQALFNQGQACLGEILSDPSRLWDEVG